LTSVGVLLRTSKAEVATDVQRPNSKISKISETFSGNTPTDLYGKDAPPAKPGPPDDQEGAALEEGTFERDMDGR
jgi:hypothetical protein